jgi:hypothetical protein
MAAPTMMVVAIRESLQWSVTLSVIGSAGSHKIRCKTINMRRLRTPLMMLAVNSRYLRCTPMDTRLSIASTMAAMPSSFS